MFVFVLGPYMARYPAIYFVTQAFVTQVTYLNRYFCPPGTMDQSTQVIALNSVRMLLSIVRKLRHYVRASFQTIPIVDIAVGHHLRQLAVEPMDVEHSSRRRCQEFRKIGVRAYYHVD